MTDEQYAPETMRERLESVERRLTEAAERAGRSREEIELVAVSKTHPIESIETLYEHGVTSFGASYVQEWEDKYEQLPDDIRWHFVGRLQSNKAKYVADDIAMVHSVDRRSVTKQLHRRSSGEVDALVQVNVAEDDSKGGVAPDGLEDLLEMTLEYPSLRLRGLMTLPPYEEDPEDNRPRFEQLRRLFDEAREWIAASDERDASIFEHLSMGMTNDFEVAVEEGATIVRLGTALFGPRDYD